MTSNLLLKIVETLALILHQKGKKPIDSKTTGVCKANWK
jgi:hypothetical protein